MPFAQPMVIHLETGPNGKKPYPIHVDDSFAVRSGLGADDGAQLIGFAERGEQVVSVFPHQVLDDPSLAVGKIATFANGGIFAWDVAVQRVDLVEVSDERPEHRLPD